MINKKNVKNIAVVAALYVGLIGFLLLFNPQKISIGWLIVPFLLLFMALFMTTLLVVKNSFLQSRVKRPRTLASLVAGVPTLILLLDSVDQLSLRDVLIIAVFGVFALFYFNKSSVK